jgi:hypothetical protein
MRRIVLVFALLMTVGRLLAQPTVYVPFAEAKKAMEASENEPKMYDSLNRVYHKRWTIGMAYGQRFITKANYADAPDTVTFTDFTSRRSFFGLEGGYFLTSRLQVFLALDMLLLPREQDINSFSFGSSGIQVEGSGSGGAMLNVGVKLGRINAIAAGGTGGFTPGSGRYQETTRLTRSYSYGNATLGCTHRLSPGFMVDFNLGYLHASRSERVGGILSPGGITSTLTLQFIIGKGNRVR